MRSQAITSTAFFMIAPLVAVALALGIVAPTTSAATLAEKQAQAAILDTQVRKIEGRYDDLQERWRGAKYELAQIRKDVDAAHVDVVKTRGELLGAKRRLSVRASMIYRSGGNGTELFELATAGSVSAFFDRIETIRRVGDQDANVLVTVQTLNTKVETTERKLKTAQARSVAAVKRADAAQREMRAALSERQAKLDSVNADVQAILAAQRRAAEARAAAAARAQAEAAKATMVTSRTSGDKSVGGSGAGSSNESGSSSDSGSSSESPNSAASASIPLPPSSGSSSSAAGAAMSKLGSPYVWAGSGPSTFDCSGLVMWAFAQSGRSLPHSSYALAGMGVDVPLSQLQVGDLVFGSGDGHVGIYVGGGGFVHAPRSGDVVKVTSMSDYTIRHARRI